MTTERVYEHDPLKIPPGYPGGEIAYDHAAGVVLAAFAVDDAVHRVTVGPLWRYEDEEGNKLPAPEYLGFGLSAFMRVGADEKYVAFLIRDPKDLLDPAIRARYETKVRHSFERSLQDHQFSGTPAAIAKVSKIDENSALMIFRMGWRAALGQADYAHSPLLGVVTE